MVLFASKQPDVTVPEDVTTWDWLFESKDTSPLYKDSDKPLGAFIDAESRAHLSWREVKSKSEALSGHLVRRYGLQAGNTVTLFSGNNIWYPVCMFAVIRIGGRVNGASPAYTVDEMAYTLKVAKTKVVITAAASLDRAVAAAKKAGISPTNIILVQGEADGFKTVQELTQQEDAFLHVFPLPYRMPQGTINRDLCGYLNFSSGTTGLPKAVMISHHNMIAQCYQARQNQVDPDLVKILAIMPLFHAMLKAIVHFQIEELVLVPPILLRLARDPIVDQFDLRIVKRWTSGAAPISPEILKSLERRFPWTGFRQGYGATEAACTAAQPPTHYDWKYGASVGMLMSNTFGKVIDTEGRELGPGETGELLFKGPQVAMGYLDNAQATAESFDADGFYHSGDAGYFDEDGQIFVKDRMKEMIKVKGSQVPPAELEDLLLGHDDVDDCAVISLPDEYAGELPKAFIVLKSTVSADDAAGHRLLEYVKNNKVRYKWLAEVEFVDKIPKSPAGKLLRRVLKERESRRGIAGEEQCVSGLRVQDQQRPRAV